MVSGVSAAYRGNVFKVGVEMANQCAILKQKGLLGCISECPKGRNYPTKCPETAPTGKSKRKEGRDVRQETEVFWEV